MESQQNIEKLAQSFIDYPAMQDPASFNLDAIKKKIEKMKSLGGKDNHPSQKIISKLTKNLSVLVTLQSSCSHPSVAQKTH